MKKILQELIVNCLRLKLIRGALSLRSYNKMRQECISNALITMRIKMIKKGKMDYCSVCKIAYKGKRCPLCKAKREIEDLESEVRDARDGL